MVIYLDGKKVGSVPYKGHYMVEVDDNNHYFEFHWTMAIKGKCHCPINKTFVGGLQLVTNRFLGSINVEFTM